MTGHRRSIRLKGYDYATPGAYFVTICTASRKPILQLPRCRDIVKDAWTELPHLFPTLELDDVVIMPDHVHVADAEEGSRRPVVIGYTIP
jgi:REP element-mobilizing transposase RayT